ncbi:MAG: hypothetical protein LBT44_04385 [Clostridiales bacterium]|nr:hypothetical protein [Clostridiales bacterium]
MRLKLRLELKKSLLLSVILIFALCQIVSAGSPSEYPPDIHPTDTPTDNAMSISISQTETMDFGTVRPETPIAGKQVTIHNMGMVAADNLLVQVNGTFFTASALPVRLPVGGAATFTITPKQDLPPGEFSAAVTVSAGAGALSAQSFLVKVKITNQAHQGLIVDQTELLDFGAAKVGSNVVYHLVSVWNDTGRAITDLNVNLSGDNAFTVGSPPQTLARDASADFVVSPKSGLAAGVYYGRVTVSGGGESKFFDLKCELQQNLSETFTLSKSGEYDFGALTAGYASAPSTSVVITNISPAELPGVTVSILGANPGAFSISPIRSLSGAIAPGGTNSFYVSPIMNLDVGTYAARVQVKSENETRELDVIVRVNRSDADISLNPAGAHDFGGSAFGYADLPWYTITVTNLRSSAIKEVQLALSGTDKDAFSLSKPTISQLEGKASKTFAIQPITGLPEGAYKAVVRVSDANSELTFDVKFTVARSEPAYVVTLIDNSRVYATRSISASNPVLGALPVPGARIGYSFVGWYINDLSVGVRAYPNTPISGDTYLYSNWVYASASSAQTPGGWGSDSSPIYERFSVIPPSQLSNILPNTKLNGVDSGEDITKALIKTAPINEELIVEIVDVDLGGVQSVTYPFKVTAEVSDLTDQQKRNLTGLLWDAGLTSYKRLGGRLSEDENTFSFYTYDSGKIGLAVTENMLTLKFTVDNPSYEKNGASFVNDVAPYIGSDNRTLVPLRAIAEALGADVGWDADTQTASLRLHGNAVYIQIGQTLPNQFGMAVITNERMFVPLRYAAQALDAHVIWNESDKSIDIYQ